MSIKSVLCIAESREQADQIVDRLRFSDFSKNDVSILFADQTLNPDFAPRNSAKAAVQGAGDGGVLDGALGWIVGVDTVAIDGSGSFVAAGPIVAALSSDAALGDASGGIAGRLIGLGIPALEANRYEGKIQSGNILISVHNDSFAQIAHAKMIFAQAEAQNIYAASEFGVPRKNRDHFKKTVRPFEQKLEGSHISR